MGKRVSPAQPHLTLIDTPSEGAVGPRQPCPCGSGRRYKACHGSADGAPPTFVARPFAGLPGETDLVALREFVPSATAPLTLAEGDRTVLLCSLLPGAAPALVREDGAIWLGLQVQHSYGDPSRDLAAVLATRSTPRPASMVGLAADPGDGPRLQDLVDGRALEVTVHGGFDFWVADLDDADGTMAEALQQANEAAAPTDRLTGSRRRTGPRSGTGSTSAGCSRTTRTGLLDGLARLHAAQRRTPRGRRPTDRHVPGTRVVAPVWDLPPGTGAEALEEPVGRSRRRLAEALARRRR